MRSSFSWSSLCHDQCLCPFVDYRISVRVPGETFRGNKMINYLLLVFVFFFSSCSIWIVLFAYDLNTNFSYFALNFKSSFWKCLRLCCHSETISFFQPSLSFNHPFLSTVLSTIPFFKPFFQPSLSLNRLLSARDYFFLTLSTPWY